MQAINKIILGTVQFGIDYGINNTSGKPDQEAVNEIFNTAYDAGIRCLDTAEAYGNAHEVIGHFHRTHPEKAFDIITKLPHYIDDSLGSKIEKYLKELNTVQLHGLLFHSYQTYRENNSSMEVLSSYKSNGKVKYLGVSVYTNAQLEDVIEDGAIDIIQLPFNLFDNSNLRGELLKKAKNAGKIIHTRSAFLQGLFFTSLEKDSRTVKALTEELTYVHQLSQKSGVHLNKICLNYCLQQTCIDNVLIGVDNITQLVQNLQDADYSLSEGLITKIDTIHIKNIDLLNPSLWNQ